MKLLTLALCLLSTQAFGWSVSLHKESGSWSPRGYGQVSDLDVTEEKIQVTPSVSLTKCYAGEPFGIKGINIKVTCENEILNVTFSQGVTQVSPDQIPDNVYFSVFGEEQKVERVVPPSSVVLDKRQMDRLPSHNKKQ